MLQPDATPMDQDGASAPDGTRSTRRASSQSPKPGSKASVRPRKKKEENSLSVEDSNQGYPKISPDLPRKPPPKPKMKEPISECPTPTPANDFASEMKRRNSRKERTVKTPDPFHIPTREELQQQQRPASVTDRPMTPRQGRAPSPEERPLVVPLPPPRVEQFSLPPPRPPPRAESPAPPLPPRPRCDPEENLSRLVVVPLPPPVQIRDPQIDMAADNYRRSTFFPELPEARIEPSESENMLPPLEVTNSVIVQSSQPPPLPEKRRMRSPPTENNHQQQQLYHTNHLQQTHQPAHHPNQTQQQLQPQQQLHLEHSNINQQQQNQQLQQQQNQQMIQQNQHQQQQNQHQQQQQLQQPHKQPIIPPFKQPQLHHAEQLFENEQEEIVEPIPTQHLIEAILVAQSNIPDAPNHSDQIEVIKELPAEKRSHSKVEVKSHQNHENEVQDGVAITHVPKVHKAVFIPQQVVTKEEPKAMKHVAENHQAEALAPIPPPQLIGKVTVESNHVPNVVINLPITSPVTPAQSYKEEVLSEVENPNFGSKIQQQKQIIESIKTPMPEPLTLKSQENELPPFKLDHQVKKLEPLKIEMPTPNHIQQQTYTGEQVKEIESPTIQESNSASSSINGNTRSLINSIPKPFKSESPSSTSDVQVNTLNKASESARSCSSLSSSGSNQSLSRRPSLHQQQSLQDDVSPGSTSLPRPDKRDSKVIKAAQYWNNYIGEVLVKNKPPENPKSLEKPKKIVSAGVGPKGYNELKNTFEQGLQRRNSKKIAVDSCLPGLRVTDALSAFEKKNQPPTPVIYRKNSVASDGAKDKPKWVRPVKVDQEPEFPFNNKQSDDLKHRAKTSRVHSESSENKPVMNGSLTNKEHVSKFNGNGTSHGTSDVTLDLKPEKVPTLVHKVSNDHEGAKEKLVTKPQSSHQLKPLEVNENAPAKHPLSPKTKVKKDDVKGKEEQLNLNAENKYDSSKHVTNDVKPKQGPIQLEMAKISPKSEVLAQKKESDAPSNRIATIKVSVEPPIKHVEEEPKLNPKSPTKKEPEHVAALPKELVKPLPPKVEPIKKINSGKSGVVVIINNKTRTQPVVNNNLLNNDITSSPKLAPKLNNDITSSPKLAQKLPEAPILQQVPQHAVKPDLKVESISVKIEPEKPVESIKIKIESEPKAAIVKPGAASITIKKEIGAKPSAETHKSAEDSKPVPVETSEAANPIEAAKNALKKIPHAPAMRRKSVEENENPIEASIKSKTPIDDGTATPTNEPSSPIQAETRSNHSERIIPIQISSDSRSREYSHAQRREHYIPIMVEGRGTILKTPDPYATPPEEQEDAERFDSFTTDSLSRRRFGSRKKRISSAFSDNSSVTTEEDLDENAFAGLQKYTSIGKHGLEEAPMFKLRKTRPPFALQREESFSSGEEDIFNDEGFREMTAENLFSTLLTRVKSLTRRIHDEHEDSAALRWQQNKRIINHPLNPGGTHARLERSALRTSIKRTGPPSSAASSTTAPSISRQSSYDVDTRSNYDDVPRYRGIRSDTESLYSESAGQGTSGEFDDSQISVTSTQRLRPGYLPPPQFNPTPLTPSEPHITYSSSTVSSRTFDTPPSVPSGNDGGLGGGGGPLERTIHINVQQHRPELPVSASSSTSSISSKPSGVYHRPAKPYTPTEGQYCDPVDAKERRVSRFLRPDFYDTPKEESIYNRHEDEDDRGKTTSRFLQAVRDRKSSLDSSSDYHMEDSNQHQMNPGYHEDHRRTPTAEGQFLVRPLTTKNKLPPPPLCTSSATISSTTSPSTTSSSYTHPILATTINVKSIVKPVSIRPPPPLKAPSPPPVSPPPYPTSPPPPLPSTAAVRSLPWVKSGPGRARHQATSPPPVQPTELTRTRRQILPYGGAKSDGLVNQHVFISSHVIAAAERKKRESYSRSSTAELPLEKVKPHTNTSQLH